MESSSETSASSSGGSIDYQIVKTEPAYEDVEVLLGQNQFVDSFPDFLAKFQGTHVIDSGGLVLGLFSIIRYSDARDTVNRKVVHAIDGILGEIEDSEDAVLFFNTRISNIPVDMVFELYRRVEVVDSHYIFISQVDLQDKRDVETAARTFKEFSRGDLRLWPRKNEEVFLLKCGRRAFAECRGAKYNVYVLLQDEFKQFLADFGNEIASK